MVWSFKSLYSPVKRYFAFFDVLFIFYLFLASHNMDIWVQKGYSWFLQNKIVGTLRSILFDWKHLNLDSLIA